MAITGSEMFSEIKPVIDERLTNGKVFLNKVAAKISAYVVKNDLLEGVYAGIIPGTPPVPSTRIFALGNLIPVSVHFDEPIERNFYKWIKNTLDKTLTWNIVSTTHTITPVLLKPLLSAIDLIGDLSDLRTADGFWAILCDAIVISILSSPTRITPVAATCSEDGSSGVIEWIPTQIPEFKGNYLFEVRYDINNLDLVKWIRKRGVEVSDLKGNVNVPVNNQPYVSADLLWKGLKSITSDCKFYKVQDDGKKLLLSTGGE